ncbi:MAG: hypothetical protein JKY42_11795 [Flavobacteriales bacterium]|nr:hypothetical protein [Flavobacteriales bacterium]
MGFRLLICVFFLVPILLFGQTGVIKVEKSETEETVIDSLSALKQRRRSWVHLSAQFSSNLKATSVFTARIMPRTCHPLTRWLVMYPGLEYNYLKQDTKQLVYDSKIGGFIRICTRTKTLGSSVSIITGLDLNYRIGKVVGTEDFDQNILFSPILLFHIGGKIYPYLFYSAEHHIGSGKVYNDSFVGVGISAFL